MSSFCIAKASHIFAAKISVYLKIPQLQVTTVNKFVINEHVKLTFFEQLGPGYYIAPGKVIIEGSGKLP